MTGFNLGCIDEIDTFKLGQNILDGENHPLDKKWVLTIKIIF